MGGLFSRRATQAAEFTRSLNKTPVKNLRIRIPPPTPPTPVNSPYPRPTQSYNSMTRRALQTHMGGMKLKRSATRKSHKKNRR